jgi:hypothetical protein
MGTDDSPTLGLVEAPELQNNDLLPVSINEFARTLSDSDDPKGFFASLQTYLGEANVKEIELYINDYEIPSSKLFAHWVCQDGKITNSIIKEQAMHPEELKTLSTRTSKVHSAWDVRSEEFQHKILMPLKIGKSLLIINMILPMEEFHIFHNTHELLKDLITIWITGMSHKF